MVFLAAVALQIFFAAPTPTFAAVEPTPTLASAKTKRKAKTKTTDRTQRPPTPTPPSKLLQRDIEISNQIDRAAERLDMALSGQKTSLFKNNTQVALRNQLGWNEGGIFSYKPAVDLHLHLPNLEKKWQLKFSTADEAEERGVNRNRLRTAPQSESYAGTVALTQKLGPVETEFEPRVEYRSRLELSYYMRFKQNWSNDIFILTPELELSVKSYAGAGEFFSLDPTFPLYKSLALTLIAEEQYVDQDNVFTTNKGARFNFDWNDVMNQGLGLVFESSSRPNYHLDRYVLSAPFGYRVLKNVVHYLVVPYLAFARAVDYRGSPGLNVEIKIIF